MPDFPIAIEYAWFAWMVSWLIAARFAARPAKRSGIVFLPIAAVAVGVALAARLLLRFGDSQLWRLPEAAGWTMFALVLTGFAFAWWARITLGRLWSGTITLKPGHYIVDKGPYGIVRHPIYTGILIAAFATVTALGQASALVAGAGILAGLFAKALAEERFLSRELSPGVYNSYRRRVPMLVPFWPKSE